MALAWSDWPVNGTAGKAFPPTGRWYVVGGHLVLDDTARILLATKCGYIPVTTPFALIMTPPDEGDARVTCNRCRKAMAWAEKPRGNPHA